MSCDQIILTFQLSEKKMILVTCDPGISQMLNLGYEKCTVVSISQLCAKEILLYTDFILRYFPTLYSLCRVQIHANCRIRRIYFSDRLYSEDELPPEFKLFLPITQQNSVGPQDMTAQQG